MASLKRNSLEPLVFVDGDWLDTVDILGLLDVIIGSDVLYERQHSSEASEVSALIEPHAFETSEVIITGSERGNRARFCSKMSNDRFSSSRVRADQYFSDGLRYEGRALCFQQRCSASSVRDSSGRIIERGERISSPFLDFLQLSESSVWRAVVGNGPQDFTECRKTTWIQGFS